MRRKLGAISVAQTCGFSVISTFFFHTRVTEYRIKGTMNSLRREGKNENQRNGSLYLDVFLLILSLIFVPLFSFLFFPVKF